MKNKMNNLQIKKIIWAYLIENGMLTDGKWCRYGGWEFPEKARSSSIDF